MTTLRFLAEIVIFILIFRIVFVFFICYNNRIKSVIILNLYCPRYYTEFILPARFAAKAARAMADYNIIPFGLCYNSFVL